MKKFEELKPIFDKIYNGINGYGVSLFEKIANSEQKYFKEVIYGETPFELLYALFYLESTKNYFLNKKIFYDLGCGIGNNVIGCYLIGNFEKYIGVELLESLYNLSEQARQILINMDKKAQSKVFFIKNNILNMNFADAEVIFFCCPNMNEEILSEIENKFTSDLKSGTIIISLIYSFKNEEKFNLLQAQNVRMAWGQTPMFIYTVK